MKRILVTLTNLLLIPSLFAAEPILIDIKIIGSAQAPIFSPQDITLDSGQDYLLVINNVGNDSISFDYGDFGQKVLTRSVQGTSSMTQQSMVINPNSKMQWHFSPQQAGEYPYHAINTSLNTKGTPGKIIVKKIESELKTGENAKEAEQKQTANDKHARSKKF